MKMCRPDGGRGQVRGNVLGDARQAQHVDLEPVPGCPHRLEVLARVVLHAERQGLAGDRGTDRLGMLGELVANGRADEVGAVGVEALLDEQVDLPEIDRAEIDGDLLRLTRAYHLAGW